MPALASDLRKSLETAVVKARELAERGAREALAALDVGGNSHISSMTAEQERLRRRLRAHGRQLGDQAGASKGSQSIERLVREMAYEHWHRMLFARFLAENQLLIEPSSGVAVSLAEVEELAAEEGTDLWELAASYAQGMLPEIFRKDDPVLALRLPLEIRQQLQALVAGLDAEVFTASDSLGWTYQFWQTKRKKEVNDSGVKIGADELSPVTQLFTEDYMVDFLLDNALGAWHAGKVLAGNPQLAETAQSEEELRQVVALPGCPWNYLRFVKMGDGPWVPAAGAFEGWPMTAAELKCLDPCMGSGHFVVAMFERLAALRIAEEGMNEKAAVAAVIEGNLFGLEIDLRCTQIAAFNLALAAWRRLGYYKLPSMNLACSGLAPNSSQAAWLALAGDNERLRNGMARLYRLFDKAAVLGSLIDPRADEADLLMAGFQELQPLLEQALVHEAMDDNSQELAVTARGLAKAAEILAGQFTLVATNVPYLGRGKQQEDLASYCHHAHPDAKADLATCFVDRCIKFCGQGMTSVLVTPQNWIFLNSYGSLRKKLLENVRWDFVAKLGANAFRDMNWWAAVTSLIVLTKQKPSCQHRIYGCDAGTTKCQTEKGAILALSDLRDASQSSQLKSPGHTITLDDLGDQLLLSNVARTVEGLSTGDRDRFLRKAWEFPRLLAGWEFFQMAPDETSLHGGHSEVLFWENGNGELSISTGARIQGHHAWGKAGVLIGTINRLKCSLYLGMKHDKMSVAVIPENPDTLPAIWAFCSSPEYHKSVRRLSQKVNVATKTLGHIPFDYSYWQKVANDRCPGGFQAPSSVDLTQYLFGGNPLDSDHPLDVAVCRLLGYNWPRQTGSSFPDCPAIGPDGLEALADEDGIVCLSAVRGEASAVERLRNLLNTALGEEWSSSKERQLLLAKAVENNAKKPEPDLESWLRSSFFSEHCKLFQSRPFIWQIWDGHPHGFSALVNYHKLASPNGQGRKTLEQLTFTYLGDWIDRQKLDQAEGVNGADDRLAAALDLQGQLKKILEGEPPYDLFVRWKPLHQQAIGWDPDINDGVRLNIRPFLNAQLRKGGKAGAGILRAKPGTIKWAKDRGKEPMRSKDDFPWFWGWDETDPVMNPADPSKCANFGAPADTTVQQGQKPRYQPVSVGDSFDGNRWNDLHYTRAAKEAARARHAGGNS